MIPVLKIVRKSKTSHRLLPAAALAALLLLSTGGAARGSSPDPVNDPKTFPAACAAACDKKGFKGDGCVKDCVAGMENEYKGQELCRQQAEHLTPEQRQAQNCIFDMKIQPVARAGTQPATTTPP
jgi:hypothetical protein